MQQFLSFVLLVLVVTYLYRLVQSWVDSRARARSERVQLLEQALQNPSVDRAALEKLAAQLTGAPAASRGARVSTAAVLALGWLALFAGAGVWVLGELLHELTVTAGGIAASIIGFGLVTYPFALRELQARRSES